MGAFHSRRAKKIRAITVLVRLNQEKNLRRVGVILPEREHNRLPVVLTVYWKMLTLRRRVKEATKHTVE